VRSAKYYYGNIRVAEAMAEMGIKAGIKTG
jgi:hypothetical protein